jgi:hypothetical protein
MMGYGYYPYFQGGINPYIYDGNGNQLAYMYYSGGTVYWEGGANTGDKLQLKNNSVHTYSAITLNANGGITYYANGSHWFQDATTLICTINNAANETYIYGGSVANDDLRLVANTSDNLSYIRCNGNSNVVIAVPSGSGLDIYAAAVKIFDLDSSGSDARITTGGTNYNIALVPNGSGLVKYGTYAAITTETLQGFITILDAAGNTRKLGVVA